MDIPKNFQAFQRLKYSVQQELKNRPALQQIQICVSAEKYTIDEILDRVESGDLSILQELNIPYTEITDEQGNQKISFKYNNERYIVNLVNNSSENTVDDVDNEEVAINPDGSKTITTRDTDGNIIKIVDYDIEGRIVHEYEPLEDNSFSDKFYTYENDELIQIQQTIHYADGNYTYIFTDGNGNLKEEQKVINNADGGITFDITREDGSRVVYNHDANGNSISSIYYDKNGNLEKTLTFTYDTNNPNIYYTEARDADDKLLYKETWENYTFTDEEGGVWYGSRCLARVVFDDINNVENTIEELRAQREECLSKLDEIEAQMLSLAIPSIPNAIDFILSNGSIDQKAYNEAMQNYNKECEEYEQQRKELNRIASETSYQLQVLDSEIAELELKQKTDKLQEDIDALKASPNANPDLINALEKQLEFVKATGTNASYEKTMLLQQQADVRLALFNLVVPTPPNTDDFIRSDGTIDEEAYREAFEQYKYKCYEYDRDKQNYEAELSIIEQELGNLELEERVKSANIDKLEENVNAAKTIQSMLDNIPDNEDNKAIIAELKNKLADLAKNVNEQTVILEQLSALNEEILNADVPTPPSTSEYQKVEYSFMDGPYKYTIINYEQMSDGTYMAKLSDNSFLMCKLQFDENGYITKLTALDKYGNDVRDIQLSMETVVDEEAYSKAFEQYEESVREYDKKMKDLNKQTTKLAGAISNLEQQVNALIFSSSAAVVENKISELRANGDNEQADALENKLNDLKKEFRNIQQQRKNLLNRENILINRLNSLVPPTPPSTNDYLNEAGTVNENDYSKAFEQYERKSKQYDRIANSINNMLEKVHSNLNELDEKELALQSEIENLVQ